MSAALIASVAGVVAICIGLGVGWWLPPHGRLGRRDGSGVRDGGEHVRRILLPFIGTTISKRALDAAVRLSRVEHATLMPCYLASVPLNLPLESSLPFQCSSALPLLEVIEQRAAAAGIEVDARIVRGRSYRDALRRALDAEHFDRVIVSATSTPRDGFTSEDLAWLLQRADAEVLILRPAPEDHRMVTGEALAGHF